MRPVAQALRPLALGLAIASIGAPFNASPAAATTLSPIATYPLAATGLHPLAIAAGPDGRLWFTETDQDALGAITPTGAAAQITAANFTSAGAEIASAGGYLWVTQPAANAIAQVSSSGTVNEYPLTSGTAPDGIAAGPDGNVWFTEVGKSAQIGRITPTGQVTFFSHGLSGSAMPTLLPIVAEAIVAGPDGNLWFTDLGGIGRITPTGTITQYGQGLSAASQPMSITAGPDGNLWFTQAGLTSAIGRITPTGVITEFTEGLPTGALPDAIVTGPDGNLWFAESAGGAVGQVTPSGVITTWSSAASASPEGITVGADQRLWLTESAAGQLAAFSPVGGSGAGAGGGSAGGGSAGSGSAGGAIGGGSSGSGASGSSGGTGGSGSSSGTGGSGSTGGGSGGDGGTTAAVPTVGQTASTSVLSGAVSIRVPGSGRYQTLSPQAEIPLGSVVDATAGAVAVTTALPGGDRTQTARVWGGRFVVGQDRRRGLTTFTLPRHLACPAPAGERAALRSRAQAKGPTLHLWASDHDGRYSTRGYNSVATVRGTVWETVESCAGTRTFVKRGLVSVRDLTHHRSVLVHAGHSYLARA